MHLYCLPGVLCQASIFDPMITASGLPARAVDLPDLDTFEAIVTTLAKDVKKGAVIVGMSMGSYLAMALAQRLTEHVAGIVLIGTSAKADTPEEGEMRRKVVRWAQREGLDALADNLSQRLLAPRNRDNAIYRAQIATMAHNLGLDQFERQQNALIGRPDQSSQLGAIKCPVLVVTGADDIVTPPEAGRFIAENVPDGRFVQLKGTGHLPLMEAPEQTAKVIAEFVNNTLSAHQVHA